MKRKPNAELADRDNPEWTDADFKRSVRFSDLPPAVQNTLSSASVSAVASRELINGYILVPLSPEIVEKFRSTGHGWQERIDAALAEWLHANSPDDLPP